MKTNNLTVAKVKTNHDIDIMIDLEREKINRMAYTKGKNFGMKEPALPLAKGDKLLLYIGEIKSAYEQLALKVLQIISPASQLPEGKIHSTWAEKVKNGLKEEIENLKKHIGFLEGELSNFNPRGILSRIRTALFIGIVLLIGEVALNTQAFQVTGDSMLSALILSISVSLAVCLGAHFAGRKYKDAKTKTEKRMVFAFSAIGITVLSGIIASLRTLYFQKIGVDINPLFFTIFNIVFFLIAAIATWYIYPTKEEMEANEVNLQKYKQLKKLKAEKKQREQELQRHELEVNKKLSGHLNNMLDGEYAIERIIRAYWESVEKFKSTNILCRKEIPSCFADEIPPLNIPHISFTNTVNKYKTDENTNDNNFNYSPAA